jgi:hypothetical protein
MKIRDIAKRLSFLNGAIIGLLAALVFGVLTLGVGVRA